MSPPRHWIEAKRREQAAREADALRRELGENALNEVEVAIFTLRRVGGDVLATCRKVAGIMEALESDLGQRGVCREGSAGV